jgi:hypothetical protein
MSTKQQLQKNPQEFCTQKMKANKTMKDRKYQTTREEKTSNQRIALLWLHTLKSLNNKRQVNGRNHHTPININTECQWTQLPHQRHHLAS